MNRLLLFFALTCISGALTAKDDDANYLAGAVPELDGKVVFSQTYDLQGEDTYSIYNRVYQWLER
ncbi:MAG: hypothetical protein LBT35_00025, partial [Tannerella sp.]|nr:hypothetical protein [Tannerella sp.]